MFCSSPTLNSHFVTEPFPLDNTASLLLKYLLPLSISYAQSFGRACILIILYSTKLAVINFASNFSVTFSFV
ncbi:hypothetical protein CW304_11860 [Bacillus sp. UFRGS-B20]|nr:hypothetical protein CW304_11860 [Bacillus sp. UFRGS-B20]